MSLLKETKGAKLKATQVVWRLVLVPRQETVFKDLLPAQTFSELIAPNVPIAFDSTLANLAALEKFGTVTIVQIN
jgi:hypothetical protein